jgi:acetyl esterase/lipase
VLKYRLQEKKGEGIPPDLNMDEACKYGLADGIQAMKVVRQHAAEWGVSPDRIGFMGFSAGAMVTSGVLLQTDGAARPAFAALIYGGPFGVMPAIPLNLPPIFIAWAQDDEVAQQPVVKFYQALKAAGDKPEVHIYSGGGHGFGMRKRGTTSDHWIEEFYWWLEARGFTTRAK